MFNHSSFLLIFAGNAVLFFSCFVLSCDCSDGLEAQSHGKESGIDSILPTATQIHYTIFINTEKSKLYHSQHPIFILSCMWTMETGFRVKLSDPKSSLLSISSNISMTKNKFIQKLLFIVFYNIKISIAQKIRTLL